MVKCSLFFTQRKCWCNKMMAKLNPSLSQWTSSSSPLSAQPQPVYPKTTFTSVLQDKALSSCALPSCLPPALLLWWNSRDVYGSFLLDGFQKPSLLFSVFVLVFSPSPFLSLSLPLVDAVDAVGQKDGVGVGGGWRRVGMRHLHVRSDKISEVHVCVFSAEILNATVAQRFHILRWLLDITHS